MNIQSNNKKLGCNNLYGSANFKYTLMPCGEFLIIEDMCLDHGSTMVHDLANVLASLVAYGFDLYNLKVIIRGTTEFYSALLMNKNNTSGSISALDATTIKQACIKYDNRYENQRRNQHSPRRPC